MERWGRSRRCRPDSQRRLAPIRVQPPRPQGSWLYRRSPSLPRGTFRHPRSHPIALRPDPGGVRTRFIKDRSHRLREPTKPGDPPVVRSEVFEPRRAADSGRLELSTYRTDDLSEGEIWRLGFDCYLPPGRGLRGRADLESSVLLEQGLGYVPQDPCGERHGSWVNWPTEEDLQLELANYLRSKATGVPHPDGQGPRKPPP